MGINQEKDFPRRKATEDNLDKKYQHKYYRPGQPYSDNSDLNSGDNRQKHLIISRPYKDDECLPKQDVSEMPEVARISLLVFWSGLQRRMQISLPGSGNTTSANYQIPTWRSRIARRLRLLWISCRLIPVRGRCMLWHKKRNPSLASCNGIIRES